MKLKTLIFAFVYAFVTVLVCTYVSRISPVLSHVLAVLMLLAPGVVSFVRMIRRKQDGEEVRIVVRRELLSRKDKLYLLGAGVILTGAIVRLLHLPFSIPLLIAGMLLSAIIFIIELIDSAKGNSRP